MATYAHQVPQRGPQEVAGLTPPAAGELALVRGLAKVLDEAVTIPGTNRKIGLDAVLGLIPGIGDLGSAAIGGYIVLVASKLGVPAVVLWRMMLNLAVDTALGAVPLVGDLFDIGFKANSRNVALLTRALADPAGTRRSSRWALAGLTLAFLGITVAGVVGAMFLFRWVTGAAG